MKWIAVVTLLVVLGGCRDDDAPFNETADTIDKVDGVDGGTGLDGVDGVDGGTGTIPGKVTSCSNELPAPEQGTCLVEPGDSKLLIQGTIATPDGLLEKGQLVVNMGKIACVGSLIGGRLFALGNFPSLVEGAKIFYIGTHEIHFLRCKSLKELTGNCSAGIFLFLHQVNGYFFGFHGIAFVWTTTTTRKNGPFCSSNH